MKRFCLVLVLLLALPVLAERVVIGDFRLEAPVGWRQSVVGEETRLESPDQTAMVFIRTTEGGNTGTRWNSIYDTVTRMIQVSRLGTKPTKGAINALPVYVADGAGTTQNRPVIWGVGYFEGVSSNLFLFYLIDDPAGAHHVSKMATLFKTVVRESAQPDRVVTAFYEALLEGARRGESVPQTLAGLESSLTPELFAALQEAYGQNRIDRHPFFNSAAQLDSASAEQAEFGRDMATVEVEVVTHDGSDWATVMVMPSPQGWRIGNVRFFDRDLLKHLGRR